MIKDMNSNCLLLKLINYIPMDSSSVCLYYLSFYLSINSSLSVHYDNITITDNKMDKIDR